MGAFFFFFIIKHKYIMPHGEIILSFVLSSITLVVGWIFGRKKQKNDFLTDQESSITLLAQKNKELIEEVVKLRSENAVLRSELAEVKTIVLDLQKKVQNLKN